MFVGNVTRVGLSFSTPISNIFDSSVRYPASCTDLYLFRSGNTLSRVGFQLYLSNFHQTSQTKSTYEARVTILRRIYRANHARDTIDSSSNTRGGPKFRASFKWQVEAPECLMEANRGASRERAFHAFLPVMHAESHTRAHLYPVPLETSEFPSQRGPREFTARNLPVSSSWTVPNEQDEREKESLGVSVIFTPFGQLVCKCANDSSVRLGSARLGRRWLLRARTSTFSLSVFLAQEVRKRDSSLVQQEERTHDFSAKDALLHIGPLAPLNILRPRSDRHIRAEAAAISDTLVSEIRRGESTHLFENFVARDVQSLPKYHFRSFICLNGKCLRIRRAIGEVIGRNSFALHPNSCVECIWYFLCCCIVIDIKNFISWILRAT